MTISGLVSTFRFLSTRSFAHSTQHLFHKFGTQHRKRRLQVLHVARESTVVLPLHAGKHHSPFHSAFNRQYPRHPTVSPAGLSPSKPRRAAICTSRHCPGEEPRKKNPWRLQARGRDAAQSAFSGGELQPQLCHHCPTLLSAKARPGIFLWPFLPQFASPGWPRFSAEIESCLPACVYAREPFSVPGDEPLPAVSHNRLLVGEPACRGGADRTQSTRPSEVRRGVCRRWLSPSHLADPTVDPQEKRNK